MWVCVSLTGRQSSRLLVIALSEPVYICPSTCKYVTENGRSTRSDVAALLSYVLLSCVGTCAAPLDQFFSIVFSSSSCPPPLLGSRKSPEVNNPQAVYKDWESMRDQAQWDAVVAGKKPVRNRSPVASEVHARFAANMLPSARVF